MVIFIAALVTIEVLLRLSMRYLRAYSKKPGAIASEETAASLRRPLFKLAAVAVAYLFVREAAPDGGLGVYISAVAILIGGILIYRGLNRVFQTIGIMVAENVGEDVFGGVLMPIAKIVKATVIVVVALALVFITGIDLTPFLFGWGFALFIIALAVQGILGDIVAGMYILIAKPFKVTDIIQLPSGETCEVVDIKDQRTVLRNIITGQLIDYSNLELLKAKLIKVEGRGSQVTLPLNVAINGSKDIERVKVIVSSLVDKLPYRADNHDLKAYLLEASGGVAKFEVSFRIANIAKKHEALDWINTKLIQEFEVEGLKLA